MKAKGVNYNTKNKLRALQAEGYTAEEISSDIQVDEEVVQGWMDHFDPPKPKKAKKDKEE